MSSEKPLLYMSNSERFWKILALESAQARLDSLIGNFDDVVICEVLRYGFRNDARMIPELRRFYREMVLPNLAEEHRFSIYNHVAGMVEHVDLISVNAFLPFIAEDSSRMVVSKAVIDYVSLGPLTGDDPISRPRDIIAMIETGLLRNEGAAFGALLHIGDPRLCRLLWPLRHHLDLDAVDEAVKCPTGLLHAAAVEFEIDWLEELEGDARDRRFGSLASGLALQKRVNQLDVVFTGQRPFPMPKEPSPREQEFFHALAKPIPLDEYARRIAPRLYALARSEPPPRLIPFVLQEWGLEPHAESLD